MLGLMSVEWRRPLLGCEIRGFDDRLELRFISGNDEPIGLQGSILVEYSDHPLVYIFVHQPVTSVVHDKH
jgi:hypothetical protein